MSQTANLERRKTERRRPPSLIYVELNASNGGMMRNLSEDGFALRAMMPLTAGEDVGFSFMLHASIRIEGQGEVVWIEGKGRVAGIRFTNISSHDRAEIQGWLNRVPEMPNGKEPEGSTAEPSRQTWNELREELLSSPSQKELTQPSWDRETRGGSNEANKGPHDEAHEHPNDPIEFPGPPSWVPAQERGEMSLAQRSESNKGRERTSGGAAGENSHAAAAPVLPDISKILLQPPSRASNYPPKPFEPLDPLSQTREMSERRAGWFTLSRAVVIMVVLAFGVAAFAYHEFLGQGLIWLGQQVTGPSGPEVSPPPTSAPSIPAATPPTATESPSTQNTETTAKPTDTLGADAGQNKSNAPAVQPDNDLAATVPPVPKHVQPRVPPPSTDDSPASGSDTDQKPGMTEYSEAVRLLHGPRGTTDPAEAARLLWISVEKGNSDAELALAELYWHGEGVARNCDQARILLGAAVRKGNLAARTRLSEFEREGCE